MSPLSQFNEYGNLASGIYVSNWKEISDCLAFNERRQELLAGLKRACEALKKAGCRRVYIGGSFVTAKEYPGDFDACWDDKDVDFEKLDPVLLDFKNRRAGQKAKYGGELFISSYQADISGKTYLDFFQVDRNGNFKGIVAIDL